MNKKNEVKRKNEKVINNWFQKGTDKDWWMWRILLWEIGFKSGLGHGTLITVPFRGISGQITEVNLFLTNLKKKSVRRMFLQIQC
ncbi:hypothetical protein [Blautia argi]|uniref:hypothetical protein n=1 Tax=Blautia argi TaxID=1912897 RepID=UPI0013A6DD78|nr:hypothetical protein [Blautia argi]